MEDMYLENLSKNFVLSSKLYRYLGIFPTEFRKNLTLPRYSTLKIYQMYKIKPQNLLPSTWYILSKLTGLNVKYFTANIQEESELFLALGVISEESDFRQ